MKITTNTQTTAYTATQQKESSSTDTAFDQYINTSGTQETQPTKTEDYIEVSETTQQETLVYTKETSQSEPYDPKKVFLNYLDKNYPNYFEKNGISKEDEEAIRSVLADNLISENEVGQLSFEQAQILSKIEVNKFEYGPDDFDTMLLPPESGKVQVTIRSTTTTQNDIMNKALFTTFVDNTSLNQHDISTILGEFSHTLKQAYSGMEIGFDIHQAPSPFGLLSQFENQNINYESYLMDILNHAKEGFAKAGDPDIKRQYELLTTNFGMILDNYQKFQNDETSQEQ